MRIREFWRAFTAHYTWVRSSCIKGPIHSARDVIYALTCVEGASAATATGCAPCYLAMVVGSGASKLGKICFLLKIFAKICDFDLLRLGHSLGIRVQF